MSNNEKKTFKKTLSCDLTQDELIDRGDQLSRLLAQVEAADAERQAENKHRQQEIGGLKAEVQRVSRQLRERAEWRDVDCVFELDLQHNEVVTRRVDTDAVVEKRAMTASERQTQLALDGTVDSAVLDGSTKIGENR